MNNKGIASLLSVGLTDQDLPLRRRDSSGLSLSGRSNSDLTMRRSKSSSLVLESSDSSAKAFTIFEQWKPQAVGQLLSSQWLLQAPVFDSACGHFKLTGDCDLPLLSSSKATQDVGSSRNSEVKECLLHHDHYRSGSSVNIRSFFSILSAN